MAQEDDRLREDRQREMALQDRQRKEDAKQIRAERLRHDAIGVAQHILDPRVVSTEVAQVAVIQFAMVAAMQGESLSPYASGPISDALMIKALGGEVEDVQYRLIVARDAQMAEMVKDPVLKSALYKYESYDPDVGDRPVELSPDEWEKFGQYENVRLERQAVIDRMTNGMAGLYDDKTELQTRLSRLGQRLESLESRTGNLNADEKKQYESLLAKMFGALKGNEVVTYSRWAGMDESELKHEEKVMLADIWTRMVRALDGGEEAELEEMEERGVRKLSAPEQKLYERRLGQLREKITDTGDKAEYDRLMAIPYYKQTSQDRDSLKAYVTLAAEEAKIGNAEVELIFRYKERTESGARLDELKTKRDNGTITKGERVLFEDLKSRAGTLTESETESIGSVKELIDTLRKNLVKVDEQIEIKSKTLGRTKEWMDLAKAFRGITSNINVTDQWRKGWHDLGAGAMDSFTKTMWTEYQIPSELIALLETKGIGQAMESAFKAMCAIGLNNTNQVPGSENIMQMSGLTDKDVQDKFIKPVFNYVKAEAAAKGQDIPDFYANFGVEMARMLFENSFVAGWLCVARDESGEVLYKWGRETPTSNPDSDAYKYGVSAAAGDGSVYVDRQNDYVKVSAPRKKQMDEFSKGYESGLPSIVPVLPDNFTPAWFSHENIVAIANGTKSLKDVLNKYPENSRWGWAYGIFRSAQIYDLVSKFTIGLKGFRDVSGEMDFFLRSPSNLGALSKKIDVAFRSNKREGQRLKANLVLALLYSTLKSATSINDENELKAIVPNTDSAKDITWVNFLEDDFKRTFVRAGFIDATTWNYLYTKRLQTLLPGEGGRPGVGMIKKSEKNIPIYGQIGLEDAVANARRVLLTDQV